MAFPKQNVKRDYLHCDVSARPVVRKVIDHDLYSEQCMAIFFKNRSLMAKKLDNSSERDFVTKRRQINLFLT